MVRSSKETIRLLLVTGDDGQNRTDKILTGSANVMKNVTTLITSAIWCICVLISVLFTFTMVIVVLLLRDKYTTFRPETGDFNDFIPETAYCKSVNAENLSLIALGYVTGKKDNYFSDSDVASKIYYIVNRDLTDQEACAVESALRLFQDKSFYIIDINENTADLTSTAQTNNHNDRVIRSNKGVDFVKLLSDQYRNLNTIKSKPMTFFNGSPFEKYFNTTTNGDKTDEQILFTAKVLTVWQFGGTAPSVNLIMNNRKVYDNNEGFCEVDREFLFCPDQCTAYVYELIKIMLNVYNETSSASNRTFSVEDVVDKSIREYCGTNVTTIGCVGINRIKANTICAAVKPVCSFLRMDEWKDKDTNWKSDVQRFCPFIVNTVFANNIVP